MSFGYSTFTITTATYTVADAFSYDLYYVDTSVVPNAIAITLPTTVSNGGLFVRFKAITSVPGGDTTTTITTSSISTQSINFAGISQIPLMSGTMVSLQAQDNGATGLWVANITPEYVPGVYGDGSDGTVTATTGSLASDMYYENLTIPNGVSLATANFRVCVRNCLTLKGTGNINNDGLPGANGAAGAGGAGGAATTPQYYPAAGGGGAGGTNSAVGVAAPTASVAQSVGGAGGNGGATAPHAGGAGGAVTAVTAANGGVKILKQVVNAISGSLPAGVVFKPGNGAGGGAGGAAATGGGGGGAGGGIRLLCARIILVTGTGSRISANGGNGGNGGGAVGSGGGSGGGGGVIIVTQTQNLLANYTGILTVSTNAGTPGTGVGAGSNSGVSGSAGTTPVVLTM